MNFKSKTELSLHIHSLQKAGYLEEKWLMEDLKDGRTKATRVYKINFDAIKKEDTDDKDHVPWTDPSRHP